MQLQLSDILAANARKTECWDPYTLLLDEANASGGLWIAASLLNHNCRGNIAVTHGASSEPDGLPDLLVARAAVDIQEGEELCHTYVYPFEPVSERQARLERGYGFSCACERCQLEAPLSERSTELADELDRHVAAFSEARRAAGATNRKVATMKSLREALEGAEREAPEQCPEEWLSQFVWGYHGLAMAAQDLGRDQEAADAYNECVRPACERAPQPPSTS